MALFVERAAVLRSSRAVALIDETRITMTEDSAGLVAQVEGPDDEATLAYFARVREFDIPGKPLYVPDFFSRLEAHATPRRMELVAWLREVHADLGKHPYDWHEIVLGRGATPRDVWELWAYSHLLHVDRAKREKWAGLGQPVQGMAKFVAFVYAAELYHLVTVVEAMLLDAKLDDRGVRMLVYGTRPEYASIPDMLQFRAARVRLVTGPSAPPQ